MELAEERPICFKSKSANAVFTNRWQSSNFPLIPIAVTFFPSVML